MSGPASQCISACVRYVSPFAGTDRDFTGQPTCAAFPDGIPPAVLDNELDHRQPIDGDHGIRFEARQGAQFPAHVFAEGAAA